LVGRVVESELINVNPGMDRYLRRKILRRREVE